MKGANEMRMIWIIIVSVLTIFIIASMLYFIFINHINQPVVQQKKQETVHLQNVGTKEKLDEYFKAALKQVNTKNRLSMPETAASADMSGAETNSFSSTNIQVEGVDEADIIKTDGTFIYEIVIAEKVSVQITKVVPANDITIEATMMFEEDFYPYQLFLHDDQLIVIGQTYEEQRLDNEQSNSDAIIGIPMMDGMSKANIYDISDRKNPVLTREVAIDGYFSTARLMNGHLYMISNQHPPLWILEDQEEADLRPLFLDSSVNNELHRIPYDQIQYIPNSDATSYLMIAAINLNDLSLQAEITTLLGNSGTVYMSKNNLYISVANHVMTPFLALPVSEDQNSEILKFSIVGNKVEFQHSATIPGTILNQFSMDEHDGYFRIATTFGNTWDEEKPSDNRLYILNESMEITGELKNLAKGERIYSARFMGDRIYLVTFKQVDPLFMIDASIPSSPKVLGELKIPGFSNYLHPYDENHLIGFGREIVEMPDEEIGFRTDGVKISIFDVSDVNNPQEKFKEVIGSSWTHSPVEYDHKALLFQKEKNIFAFPIQVYEEIPENKYEEKEIFQGGYIYNIDINHGLQLQKKITHLTDRSNEDWKYHIQRLIYIDDIIYSVSSEKITAHQMDRYNLIGELERNQ